MPESRDLGATAARIEWLLAEAQRTADPAVADRVQELMRLLMALYGAGLERIVSTLTADGPTGQALLERLLADELVASLLVLHELHPLDVAARIQQALDGIGVQVGPVELLGVDADGVAHVRLAGAAAGRSTSAAAVRGVVERVIMDAAPEVTRIEVEGAAAAPAAPAGFVSIESLRGGAPAAGSPNGARPAMPGGRP